MTEETTTPTQAPSEAPAAPAPNEELIMCYVSKKMVPMSETVEVSYAGNKKFRVLPQYIKY